MSILDSIPDISFIGDISVEKLKEIGINEYKSALSEITGETVTQISDEDKAKIYAQAQIMYQVAEIINNRARQNSLKYASGAYLDNKAISRLLQRKQEDTIYIIGGQRKCYCYSCRDKSYRRKRKRLFCNKRICGNTSGKFVC